MPVLALAMGTDTVRADQQGCCGDGKEEQSLHRGVGCCNPGYGRWRRAAWSTGEGRAGADKQSSAAAEQRMFEAAEHLPGFVGVMASDRQ